MMVLLRILDPSSFVEVWDGAHILELVLDHASRPYKSLADTKDSIANVTKFFRYPSSLVHTTINHTLIAEKVLLMGLLSSRPDAEFLIKR